MATRTVQGTILTPTGQPWADFAIHFTLTPSTFTDDATLPSETVIATTDATGTFAIDLETDVAYTVTEDTALVRSGTSTRYPAGTQYTVVVPAGAGPVALHALQAAHATPTTPTLLGRIEALEALLALMTGGTTGQILEKQSDAPLDMAWVDHVARYAPEEEV